MFLSEPNIRPPCASCKATAARGRGVQPRCAAWRAVLENADVFVGQELRQARVGHRQAVDQNLEKRAVKVVAAQFGSLRERLRLDLDYRDIGRLSDARRALELLFPEVRVLAEAIARAQHVE